MTGISGRLAAAIASLVLAGGCATLLDTHADGTAPDGPGALPGPPGGDSLGSGGSVIFNEANVQIVSSAQTQSGVSLRPAASSSGADYLINLSGVMLSISPRPLMAMEVRDPVGRVACGIDIADGDFRLVQSGGAPVIGSYGPGDLHRILLRVSRRERRCVVNIQLTPQGSDPGTAPETPPIDASGAFVASDFDSLSEFRLVWELPVSAGQTSYFLGPVRITVGE